MLEISVIYFVVLQEDFINVINVFSKTLNSTFKAALVGKIEPSFTMKFENFKELF